MQYCSNSPISFSAEILLNADWEDLKSAGVFLCKILRYFECVVGLVQE